MLLFDRNIDSFCIINKAVADFKWRHIAVHGMPHAERMGCADKRGLGSGLFMALAVFAGRINFKRMVVVLNRCYAVAPFVQFRHELFNQCCLAAV